MKQPIVPAEDDIGDQLLHIRVGLNIGTLPKIETRRIE
jgi:hypothetical protein